MKQRLVVAIVVKDGEVLSYATNKHKESCKRVGYPTGEGYELCEGCNYPNHAEVKALQGIDAKGATLHLFGHYYACEPCNRAITEAGVEIELH
jgi:deoxycytidylate deaminase